MLEVKADFQERMEVLGGHAGTGAEGAIAHFRAVSMCRVTLDTGSWTL